MPMHSIIDDKFAWVCVKLSAIVALFTAIVAGVTLFVFIGNDRLTDNFLAFAICMMAICPICALSGLCATRRKSGTWMKFFVMAAVFSFASLFGVMVAYLVEPDDQQSLAGLFPKNTFLIVGQYTIVLMGAALAVLAGLKGHAAIVSGRIDRMFKVKGDEEATMVQTGEFDNVVRSVGSASSVGSRSSMGSSMVHLDDD